MIPMTTVRQFGVEVADPFARAERLLCSFSCGVTSAVATKLAIEQNAGRLPVHIMYAETRSEHEDNVRMRADCERWFGHEICGHSNDDYRDIWDVFERRSYIAGVKGAACATSLKKHVYEKVEKVTDLIVVGYEDSARQRARAKRLWENHPEKMAWFPLIDARLSKDACCEVLRSAGIALPAMYLLGFDNNNCIGCPKGGNAYWNNVRNHFPDAFRRMAAQARALNVRTIKLTVNGIRGRYFLDELPPDATDDEPVDMSCGIVCQQPADEALAA